MYILDKISGSLEKEGYHYSKLKYKYVKLPTSDRFIDYYFLSQLIVSKLNFMQLFEFFV